MRFSRGFTQMNADKLVVSVFLILRDWLAMENDPRSHTKQLCSCDLVWFRGSFLCNPRKHTKRNSDTIGQIGILPSYPRRSALVRGFIFRPSNPSQIPNHRWR